MRPERALGLLLFVCLISLTPLAYASPPDPTWIEGVYDDADGDDVVVSLCRAAWVAQPAPQTTLAPLFVAVPFTPLSVSPIVSRELRPTPPGRAPPLS